MIISIIAAIGKKRELGKDNKLLWHIPEDMKRFKQLTTGHTVIMGRKTFESIGKPLPNRTNIVVTRDKTYKAEGCILCTSLQEALQKAEKDARDKEVFIIGGAQIYAQALTITDRLYLTLVDGEWSDADVFFPNYSTFKKEISKKKGEGGTNQYEFVVLER